MTLLLGLISAAVVVVCGVKGAQMRADQRRRDREAAERAARRKRTS